MSNNVSDIKPWFKEDIFRLITSIYFAHSVSPENSNEGNNQYRAGFAEAMSSFAISAGIDPKSFLTPKDIQLIYKK